MRLVVLPGIVYVACTMLHTDSLIRSVCVVMTAMPAASLTAVLATRYHGDAKLGALIVAVSTILSTVTIPLWFLILQ